MRITEDTRRVVKLAVDEARKRGDRESVMASIAAACVDRAWTSSPTHVIVPDMAGRRH